MTRPPRDLSRTKAKSTQFAMTIRKDLKDMIKAEAQARGVTIVSLVEKSIMAYCQKPKDDTHG